MPKISGAKRYVPSGVLVALEEPVNQIIRLQVGLNTKIVKND